MATGSDVTGDKTYELYSPPHLSLGPRPIIYLAPERVAYGQEIGLQFASADPVQRVILIRTGSSTHSVNFGAGRGAARCAAPVAAACPSSPAAQPAAAACPPAAQRPLLPLPPLPPADARALWLQITYNLAPYIKVLAPATPAIAPPGNVSPGPHCCCCRPRLLLPCTALCPVAGRRHVPHSFRPAPLHALQYMLVLVSARGVPSVAKIITVA